MAQPVLNIGSDGFHTGKHCTLCQPQFNIALPEFAWRISAQSSHTISQTSLLGRRPAVRRKPLNLGRWNQCHARQVCRIIDRELRGEVWQCQGSTCAMWRWSSGDLQCCAFTSWWGISLSITCGQWHLLVPGAHWVGLCHQATCKWNEQPFDGTSSGDEKIHWLPEEDPGQLQPLEDPELWQGHSSQLRLQVDPWVIHGLRLVKRQIDQEEHQQWCSCFEWNHPLSQH